MKPIWVLVSIEVHKYPETYLVRNIQCLVIRSQPDVRLLAAIWSDEGVDLCNINIIKFLDRLFNLTLVGL